MKLRKLIIQKFRGIDNLEWEIKSDLVCLVGPGDSTKSTILLALEYLFSPNWNLPITDSDFHQMVVLNPIIIEAIITELPESLLSEEKFGLYLGFWNNDGGSKKNQENDDDHIALKIRLTIDSDLEPVWEVLSFQEDEKEPRRISSTDRQKLGVAKIGSYVDADLAWGRNSALSRLTQRDDLTKIPSLLAEAERKVLNSLAELDLSLLEMAIGDIIPVAQIMGINAQDAFHAGIDPLRVSLRQGAISLFDGQLPLSLRGAGSRRLMTMAIHKSGVKEGAVILVDEIENSLEPYRLRHLIRQLRPNDNDNHQVLFTTHSSVTVVECIASEIFVVNSQNGNTKVIQVSVDLQNIVRSIPEAFLCRKVIICEGKTESGLLFSLDQNFWQNKHEKETGQWRYLTMAEAGVSPIESPKSGGSEAPKFALAMAKLGYEVAYFGDSDRDLNPSAECMKENGIDVFLWDGNVEIERRLCFDLPQNELEGLITLAENLNDRNKVWADIKKQFSTHISPEFCSSWEGLISLGDERKLRELLGKAADDGKWFKRRDKGESLGTFLTGYLDMMGDTPTFRTLVSIEKWCYG